MNSTRARPEPDDLDIEISIDDGAPDLDGGQELIIDISHEVYDAIEVFAATDTTKELGGVLIGSKTMVGGDILIEIIGSIEAKYAEAQQGRITFSHKSWEYIHAEKQRLFPDLLIVGWFHTHPGFGIFLSEDDLFIHRNFFDLPWQIAYVVDPKQRKRGFFCWDGDKVVRTSYQVGGEVVIEKIEKLQVVNDRIRRVNKRLVKKGAVTEKKLKYLVWLFCITIVVFAVVSAFIWFGSPPNTPTPS